MMGGKQAGAMVLAAICLTLAVCSETIAAENRTLGDVADLLRIDSPGYLETSLYAGGFVSQDYAQIQQGFQLEQSVNDYFGIFCRVAAFQIFQNHMDAGKIFVKDHDGDVAQFVRLTLPSGELYFGRFQAGLDLSIAPTTSLLLSGGADAGDDSNPLIEADLSSWLFTHSLHPLLFSVASIFTIDDRNTSASLSLDTVARSNERWLMMVGAGGAIFDSATISGVGRSKDINEGEPIPLLLKFRGGERTMGGQGGVDFNGIYRPWQTTLGIQLGYGTSGYYAEIAIIKQLAFLE